MTYPLPLDISVLMRKKSAFKEKLLLNKNLLSKRIAVLGGSTTAEVVEQLELFLLSRGIKPEFYQSEYNRYYEDALFPSDALLSFKPELVYLHTTTMNITDFPAMDLSPAEVDHWLEKKLNYFKSVWQGIENRFGCPIVQNNFEEPWFRPLGNLDGVDYRGRSRLMSRLNESFAKEAEQRSNLYINDIHYLSARLGMDQWFSPRLWYLYKYALDMEVIPHLTHHLSALIASLWGVTNKCLVIDLDNTLWGGVIGDDGVEGIQLGTETAEAEAYRDFQCYLQAMKSRGILLAVCSKNDETNARAGFAHPDSVLRQEDFTAFKANWDSKPQNIQAIANEINIGVDSLVFVDDNPVERDIVRSQLPDVSVPEIGSDITDFIRIVDSAALFEVPSLLAEDIQRSQLYRDNSLREKQQAQFASYDEFLTSLHMVAEIAPFSSLYMDRITQLTNKTNQYNLTTRRYTQVEMEAMAESDKYITLYGRLQDKFGDNGLISVVAGEIKNKTLHIDLWLMSCRVLKRGVEDAMFEKLYKISLDRGIKTIVGYYRPTAKNKMVCDLYRNFGFKKISESDSEVVWQFDLSSSKLTIKHMIEVAHG